jgi:serine/threonine protein kinase
MLDYPRFGSTKRINTMSGNPRQPQDEPLETVGSLAEVSTSIWSRRYRFVRELREAGMARILLVERASDSLPVCLKFLNSKTCSRTLEQECRALMRLRHPAIVSLLDFSFEDTPPWLATEYISGHTLQTHLRENPQLSLEAVIEILKALLDALAYSHDQNVIHRDLKPANLMVDLTSGVQLRILDFGLAIIDNFDHEGNPTARDADVAGTLTYMAPEQLEGQRLSTACDLYAAGLMGWEMLMGRSLFKDKAIQRTVLEKMRHTEGFPLGNTSESIPEPLRGFVQDCTRLDPLTRPTARTGIAVLASLS